jgi:hypothetical protein
MTESTFNRRTVLAAAMALATTCAGSATTTGATNVYQLRIYEIFDRNKAAFHDRFRDHATCIMARHGFDIVSMWEARGESGPEFVYLLRWPNEDTVAERWAGFMADEEWSRIKEQTAAQHGALVGRIQSRVMHLALYSAPPR